MKDKKLELYFFFVAFVAILILTFILFLPFLSAIAVALVFAVIFHPVHLWILERVRLPGLSALLALLFIVLIVFTPLAFFGFLLFSQAQDLFVALNANGGQGSVNAVLNFVETHVSRFLPGFTLDVSMYVKQGLEWLTQSLGDIFASTAQAVLSFFIGLIALYYFFRDGKWFRTVFITYSPLRDTYDNEILARIRLTINSILKGSILTALIQGTLSGIGFAFFGVPHAVLWGAIAAIGALIPGVGTTIVILPTVLYLYFFGSTVSALGLLIWGALAVGLIDNFLGPILIGRGVRIHPLVVLIAVLGGLNVFGPVGFLLGPIIFSLLLALAEIYNFLVKNVTSHHTKDGN